MGIYADMKTISSLEKMRPLDELPSTDIKRITALKGESVNFQVYVKIEERLTLPVTVESELSKYATLYQVRDTIIDFIWGCDDDVMTDKPGIMPDILIPLEEQNGFYSASKYGSCMWVNIKLPEDIKAGEYDFTVYFGKDSESVKIEVVNEVIEENTLKYTQWFHPDCIASSHNVPMYSKEHWKLIENYMLLACEVGINMVLTPVLPLNLDTDRGYNVKRPDCSLTDIAVTNGVYSFSFSRLDRYIDLALKCGMQYFEISHLYHAGGAEWCINIEAEVDGERKYIFDSSVRADNEEYVSFLKAFVPALTSFLKDKGVFDKCYFHISDEPNKNNIDIYEYANKQIKPLFEGRPLMDALSEVDFAERGLMDVAVAEIAHIEDFIDKDFTEKWCYYCCGDWYKVSNRLLFMPSYRNRIIGLQMYKYGFDGFLHWGYNFTYVSGSMFDINPYVSQSSSNMFPSGDAASVYPSKNGAYPSIRAFVFKEAIEDIQLCRTLEKYIGKERVVELIDREAGMGLDFKEYPRNSEFLLNLTDKMRLMIKEFVK